MIECIEWSVLSQKKKNNNNLNPAVQNKILCFCFSTFGWLICSEWRRISRHLSPWTSRAWHDKIENIKHSTISNYYFSSHFFFLKIFSFFLFLLIFFFFSKLDIHLFHDYYLIYRKIGSIFQDNVLSSRTMLKWSMHKSKGVLQIHLVEAAKKLVSINLSQKKKKKKKFESNKPGSKSAHKFTNFAKCEATSSLWIMGVTRVLNNWLIACNTTCLVPFGSYCVNEFILVRELNV